MIKRINVDLELKNNSNGNEVHINVNQDDLLDYYQKNYEDLDVNYTSNVNISEHQIKRHTLAIKYILKDINNDKSAINKLYRMVYGALEASDKVNVTIKTLKALFKDAYISDKLNDEKYKLVCVTTRGLSKSKFYFQCCLKAERLNVLPNFILKNSDVLKTISVEEMIDDVLPQYYLEIGMWDREELRSDLKAMEYISENWIEDSFAELG